VITPKTENPVFREGDEVVLAEGPYKPNLGIFLRLREDPNWADGEGRDGRIMSHPVEWRARSTPATPGRDRESQRSI
jgi:hypothetical protein